MPENEKKVTGKKICSTDAEFEELFLPGTHEKKKIQEAIKEPGKFKDHLLKRMRK